MKILSHLNTLRENNYLKKIKELIRLFLGLPLTILSLYFLFTSIWAYRDTILLSIQQINFFLLFVGFLLYCIFFYIKAYIWYLLLPSVERKHSKSILDYQLSEIARYAPFNIASFISRISRFESKTLYKKQLLKLMGVEMIIVLLGALIISIPAIFFIINRYTKIPNSELNIILLCIAVVILLWMFGKSLLVRFIRFLKEYLLVGILASISWLFYGLGSYFVAISLSYLDPVHFSYFISLFVYGWLLGFIAFIVPMGIGVREFIVLAGLTPFTTLPLATAIVAMQRVVFTFSEIINLLITFYVLKSKHLQKLVRFIYIHRIEAVITVLSTVYAIYFSYLSMEKHNNFFTGKFDLGNMDQVVWNTLQGRIFLYTNPDSTETISRLSAHADFILILLSPFYLIWSDPRTLLIIQSVVLAMGSVFVYLLGMHILRNKYASFAFAISYLLNPLLQRQNLYDFHAITLATTFLLATFYFLIKKRFILFGIFLLLAVLTKEHIYLVAFFFGCYLFIKKYKKAGIFLATSSFIVFYLLINTFIPQARGGIEHFALSNYQEFGDSPTAIAHGLVTDPIRTIRVVITPENVLFLHYLFSSIGYLVFFAPLYLLFAAGDFAISLLSTNDNFRSIHYHYAAAMIPFVYIASLYGFKKVRSLSFINEKFLIGYIIGWALFSTWAIGVLPGTRYPQLDAYTRRLSYKEDIYKFIDSIPSEKSVAATNNIGAHFSQREHIYTIPQGIDKADIIVFLLTDKYASPSPTALEMLAQQLASNPSYRELIHIQDFRAFERRAVASTLLDRVTIGEK